MCHKLVFICLCLALAVHSNAAKASTNLFGQWRINQEETDKVRVEFKEGSGIKRGLGGFKPTVTIGGLPLPKRAKQGPMSSLAAKDPQVLRCTNMHIAPKGNKLTLIYDEAGKETLAKGNYRGRTSSWSSKKIEQRYKTTERTVKKTWILRKDGRLEVAVKLNPKGDKARTHKRVFDRVADTINGDSE